jgi:hypothetical protein
VRARSRGWLWAHRVPLALLTFGNAVAVGGSMFFVSALPWLWGDIAGTALAPPASLKALSVLTSVSIAAGNIAGPGVAHALRWRPPLALADTADDGLNGNGRDSDGHWWPRRWYVHCPLPYLLAVILVSSAVSFALVSALALLRPALPLTAASSAGVSALFLAALMWIGIALGTYYSLFPTLTSETFGARRFPTANAATQAGTAVLLLASPFAKAGLFALSGRLLFGYAVVAAAMATAAVAVRRLGRDFYSERVAAQQHEALLRDVETTAVASAAAAMARARASSVSFAGGGGGVGIARSRAASLASRAGSPAAAHAFYG